MDVEEARDIVATFEIKGIPSPYTRIPGVLSYREAKGFLAGLEQERERAQPLIEALEFLVNNPQGGGTISVIAQEALSHYQRSEQRSGDNK